MSPSAGGVRAVARPTARRRLARYRAAGRPRRDGDRHAEDASACRIGPSVVADDELYATRTNGLLPCAGALALAGLVLPLPTNFGGGDADAADDGDTDFTFFGASAGAGAALVLRF